MDYSLEQYLDAVKVCAEWMKMRASVGDVEIPQLIEAHTGLLEKFSR